MLRQFLQEGGGLRALLERGVGHYGLDAGFGFGKLADPQHFVPRLVAAAGGLHEHDTLHLHIFGLLEIVIGQVGAVEDGIALDPAIFQAGRVPEVHMRVDNGERRGGRQLVLRLRRGVPGAGQCRSSRGEPGQEASSGHRHGGFPDFV